MSSPKFRLTILGIKPGYDLETVRLTLANSMNASEQEVDALLQNRAPITQESLPHRDAWMVKSDLLGMGVDCQIKPAPLHGLKERAGTMSLQVPTMHKELTPKPPVIRNARHATRTSVAPPAGLLPVPVPDGQSRNSIAVGLNAASGMTSGNASLPAQAGSP